MNWKEKPSPVSRPGFLQWIVVSGVMVLAVNVMFVMQS